MSLSALAAVVVVPPASFLVLALVGACGAASSRFRRAGLAALAAALGGLWITSMPTVARALIAGLETGLAAPGPPDGPQDGPGDGPAPGAIVVLGGDQTETRERPWFLSPGPLSLERERAAARLARRTGLPVLVTGGPLHRWSAPVAQVMADSLRDDFQLAPRWVEPRSGTTWENARFSAPMLRAAHIDAVYVVTHAWHMRRALIAFRRAGVVALPAPVSLDAPPNWRNLGLLPSPRAWLDTYFALHEWIGCAWYAIRP